MLREGRRGLLRDVWRRSWSSSGAFGRSWPSLNTFTRG